MATTLTQQERQALHERTPVRVGGGPQSGPGDELERIGAWCRENGWHPDRYGDDKQVAAFEAKVAALLGLEAAVFMPSGTMAQQIALRIAADHAGTTLVAMHPTAHLELHELGAYTRLHRLEGILLGPRQRPTMAADLAAYPERLAALLVELPAREIGGQLPSWDELNALSALARARGIHLHMDGARLWEAREAYAPRTFADICALFDSVYVSFYKGIGALGGAMLAGTAAFVGEARAWRKRHGGSLWHLYPYVASAAMRLDAQLVKMPAYRARALSLADRLSRIPGMRILPSPPQVNLFHLYLSAPPAALAAARDQVAAEDGTWLAYGFAEAPVPGWSFLEMSAGDNLLALDDEVLVPLYAKLMAVAQAAQA
ncbi:MAG: beta-eliminating lyase-related protein, partial [Casimicrobiaceae bacterium]